MLFKNKDTLGRVNGGGGKGDRGLWVSRPRAAGTLSPTDGVPVVGCTPVSSVNSGSQLGWSCSQGTFGKVYIYCWLLQNWCRGVSAGTSWVEARDSATKHSMLHRRDLKTKSYLAPKVDSAEIKEPWFRRSKQGQRLSLYTIYQGWAKHELSWLIPGVISALEQLKRSDSSPGRASTEPHWQQQTW